MRTISILFACFSLSLPALALAASNGIPAGYYVGPGDGSVVVFHVLPGGKKASVSVAETIPNLPPVTPKMVIGAATHGEWTGTLNEASPGRYHFVLGTPAHPGSYCIHTVTVTPKGLLFREAHTAKFQMGCVYYHGASWGYSAPVAAPLRPYKVR